MAGSSTKYNTWHWDHPHALAFASAAKQKQNPSFPFPSAFCPWSCRKTLTHLHLHRVACDTPMHHSKKMATGAPPPPPPMPPACWAKRTGFKGFGVSGESNASSDSAHIELDLESGRASAAAAAKVDNADPENKGESMPVAEQSASKRRGSSGGSNGHVRFETPPPPSPPKHTREEGLFSLPQVLDEDENSIPRQSHIKYLLRDRPGYVHLALYGIQHNLSMLGSLVLVPLVLVPAMGGTEEDTSAVVSTVLFISGTTTLMHTSFGSRLPLVQGPSFVYLAPALAIIKSQEFLDSSRNNFGHIMKELQGALIISSAFQAIIGYTGLMSLFLRLVNPVVVSPTVAAIGLSFFSYGFTQVGSCLEIGIMPILLVIIFSLYLRKISLSGHRVFLIYAVPLGLGISWSIAFLLTEAGAYGYKGCDINVSASNTLSAYCRKHVSRMKHCRVDTSHALESSPWFRFPSPLQWGTPSFNWKMAFVMCAVSLIASVDSVGSYHASSLLVASRPPTIGVVSRGIGFEGISSVLAGLWGTGIGSTTLTENVHAIAVTKMGSRRGVEVGACILIVLSFVGKVGGLIASIPDVIVAALLCFMWGMLAALGLSNLRYSEAGSSRNVIIVGLSLFFSLSVPYYFQQYESTPNRSSSVPSYFQSYTVASHGPFRSTYGGVNYIMNTLLSLHMIIAFLIAVVLDNTVPGSLRERGVYIWSEPEAARSDAASAEDYELPFQVGQIFRWVKWVGL